MDNHQTVGVIAYLGDTILDSSDFTHLRPVNRHGLFEPYFPANNGSMDTPAREPRQRSGSTASLLATLAEHAKRPHEHVPSRLPETNVSAAFIMGSGKGYEAMVRM